ncbi:MAG: hypothetical protein WCC26_07930 [Terracidiphilus sp.]
MRLDVYSVAYEEANSELLDITKRFELLRRRKECLQAVVASLAPILGVEIPSKTTLEPVGPAPSGVIQPPSDPGSYTFNQVPVPLPGTEETGGDPFQRRVRNALKMGNTDQEHRGLQTAV